MRREQRDQRGVALVENLVAMAILSISLVGSVSIFSNTSNSNRASRSHAALVAEVQDIVDQYREEAFNTLLTRFNTNITAISNGARITESYTSTRSRATFTSTLTAIHSRDEGSPEAIRLNVSANQRRGKLGNRTYTFETIVANVKR